MLLEKFHTTYINARVGMRCPLPLMAAAQLLPSHAHLSYTINLTCKGQNIRARKGTGEIASQMKD
jgi:hypothetical protein